MAAIRKRGDKWQCRVQLKGFDPVSKSFHAKIDAEAWGKVTESEMIRGAFIKRTDSEKTTLGDALDRYLKEVTPTKRGHAQEAQRIASWQADKLAGKSLASLRSTDFAQWRDRRLKTVKPATVRLDLALVSNLFNVARREWGFEGLINPVEAIRLPSVQNSRSRQFLDGEEALLFAILAPSERDEAGRYGVQARNPWLAPLVRLAVETAMRQGELLALKWENVRLADRVAHLPMTKNGSSRTVPLSPRAVEILKALPRSLKGQVFPLSSNAVKLGFSRAVKRARALYEAAGGTDDRMLVDLHFHDLRHVAITRLAGRLPNLVELAAVSGHQDVRMLQRYYHPKATDLARKLG